MWSATITDAGYMPDLLVSKNFHRCVYVRKILDWTPASAAAYPLRHVCLRAVLFAGFVRLCMSDPAERLLFRLCSRWNRLSSA